MGLFGPTRMMTPPTPAPLVDPTKVAAGYTPPPRRGLFGRFGGMQSAQGANPLMLIGAALQEAGGQQGAIGDLQDRLQRTRLLDAQSAWQSEQQQRQRQEWAAGDAQTAAVQQWISTLPPAQQALARANPSAVAEAFIKQMQGGDWRPGYGRAIRINPDGSTSLGGSLPTPPASAYGYGGVPDGWEVVE